jgi:hypothetical protein
LALLLELLLLLLYQSPSIIVYAVHFTLVGYVAVSGSGSGSLDIHIPHFFIKKLRITATKLQEKLQSAELEGT